MRNIDDELQKRLDSGATTMCRCWLIKRKDGDRFGFTDHDRDLQIGADLFKASSGANSSVIEASLGLSVDNAQAAGALTDVGLTETDIMAGKYDGAEVWQWLVDWKKPDLKISLFRGFLGEIRRGKSAFEAELRGLSETLNRPLGRSYTRECDCVLGDTRCALDVEQSVYLARAVVVKETERRQFTFSGLSGFQSGWFENGLVRWTSGANAGLVSLVKSDILDGASRAIETWEQVRLPICAGETANLIAGCDKRAETCRIKFDNFLNFRGFPHIPGEDWVTAYPASGEIHDGSGLIGANYAG